MRIQIWTLETYVDYLNEIQVPLTFTFYDYMNIALAVEVKDMLWNVA
jgi:hypothetical protein